MLIKYKYNPIEAYQWFKNGDHPRDSSELITPEDGPAFLSEGKVVRRFRDPKFPDSSVCPQCGNRMMDHGWMDPARLDLFGTTDDYYGSMVCPGDWILNDVNMVYSNIVNDYFNELFEKDRHVGLDELLAKHGATFPLY